MCTLSLFCIVFDHLICNFKKITRKYHVCWSKMPGGIKYRHRMGAMLERRRIPPQNGGNVGEAKKTKEPDKKDSFKYIYQGLAGHTVLQS